MELAFGHGQRVPGQQPVYALPTSPVRRQGQPKLCEGESVEIHPGLDYPRRVKPPRDRSERHELARQVSVTERPDAHGVARQRQAPLPWIPECKREVAVEMSGEVL